MLDRNFGNRILRSLPEELFNQKPHYQTLTQAGEKNMSL